MADTIPDGVRVTYARQYRRCGKATCRRCAEGAGHGPYWYAFWDQDGRRRSCYLGKQPPAAAQGFGEPLSSEDRTEPRAGLRVRTLGAFLVWRGATALPASAWRSETVVKLFQLLLTTEGHRLHREQVLELLWPDAPPDQGRKQLYATLYRLRKALDPPHTARSCVVLTREHLALVLPEQGTASSDWLDAAAFARAARVALGGRDAAACAAAIALYEGDYLPDARYDDWATARRNELRGLYIAALLHQARLAIERGAFDGAIPVLHQALAADRGNEQATSMLMTTLAATGARTAAIRAYQDLERSLREDLNMSPSAELYARYISIVAHPTNLPAPLTSFIGREQELAALAAILPEARMLSLVGAGGCGKTRLALQLSTTMLYQFQHGVWLVDLAPVADAQALPHAVLAALGIAERATQSVMSTILDNARDRHLLLIMDNCEHLLDAAAAFIGALLTACPDVRVVATSREALEVAGEVTWPVPPLSLTGDTGPDALPDAVRLFLARLRTSAASRATPDVDRRAVGRICQQLDGLPLAIELAAARAGSIPLEQIEAHLDDRYDLLTKGPRTAVPRQRTLRATMDWSYGLLDAREQCLLRRLSVFAGGCAVEAVAAIAGLDLDPRATRLLLDRLCEKSLVQRFAPAGEPRYGMLETIRQYGAVRLAECGERDTSRERHCRWFLEGQEAADAAWYTAALPAALSWMDRELENLRAALAWASEHEEQTIGVRFLAALWRYWELRGHIAEGRRWQERVLGDTTPRHPTTIWARAMAGAGRLAELAGDYARAATWYENSLTFWRALGERQGIADVLLGLGVVRASQGDLEQAERLFGEALALNRALDHQPGIIVALNNLGGVAFYRGDRVRTEELWRESLERSRKHGDARSALRALNNLGELARGAGQHATALRWYREGLLSSREIGDLSGTVISLEGISAALCAQEVYELATHLRGALDAARAAAGFPITPRDRRVYDRDGEKLLSALGTDRFEGCLTEGRRMDLAAAIDLALKVPACTT